ncbi:MAG: hypothetical protein R3C16_11195 [Hyphomonadaceae bacterium]
MRRSTTYGRGVVIVAAEQLFALKLSLNQFAAGVQFAVEFDLLGLVAHGLAQGRSARIQLRGGARVEQLDLRCRRRGRRRGLLGFEIASLIFGEEGGQRFAGAGSAFAQRATSFPSAPHTRRPPARCGDAPDIAAPAR